MMQWLKSHLTVVITSAISLIAIALLVLGAMDKEVANRMRSDSTIFNNIKGMRQPVNQRIIEMVSAEQDKNQQKIEKILKQFENIGTHKPINNYVFPKLDPGKQNAPFKFKADYKEEQRKLIATLKAGERPTDEEIDQEERRLEAKKATEEAAEGRNDRKNTRSEHGAITRTKKATSDTKKPSEMTIEEIVEEDAEARLSLENARQYYCYASADTSLQEFQNITHGGDKPTPEEMWYAQLALWIQQDVIQALASLNQSIAEKLPENDRWVGNLPVKHLLGFWVGGYVTSPTGSGGRAGRTARSSHVSRTIVRSSDGMGFRQSSNAGGQLPNGAPPGNASDVFTNNSCKSSVDVVQFALNLVIEAKMLPSIINTICEAGFYTPLMVTYEAAPQGKLPIGYIYGSAPILAVRLEFEGCFLRNNYEEWMPEAIKTYITGAGEQRMGTSSGTQQGHSRSEEFDF
ncbi:MAG: hypothetical protein ACYTF1_03580 [Planctomycetota bacterium]|jgi:hypothetical protein